jgi:hypothetical protein
LYLGIAVNKIIRTLCIVAALSLTGSCNPRESSKQTNAIQGNGFTSPEAVLQAFCELDAHGKRIPFYSSDEELSFYREMVSWTIEPSWDKVIMISGYKISKKKLLPRCAEIAVTYTVKGRYSPGVTAFYKSMEKIEFRVIETESGWKIQGPVVHPHTYPAMLIQSLQNRVKNAADAKERKKLQKDINLIKNMRRFLLDTNSVNL